MKKNYIIPTTESIAFLHAGSLCSGSGDAGTNVTGNALGGGGEVPGGTTIDPM